MHFNSSQFGQKNYFIKEMLYNNKNLCCDFTHDHKERKPAALSSSLTFPQIPEKIINQLKTNKFIINQINRSTIS